MPNKSSISAALRNIVFWLCWRTASVARKIGTSRSFPPGERHIADAPLTEVGIDYSGVHAIALPLVPFHRKPAQHEGARAKPWFCVLTLGPNQLNDLHALWGLSRNGKAEIRSVQNLPSALKAGLNRMVLLGRYALRQKPPRRLQMAAGSGQSSITAVPMSR